METTPLIDLNWTLIMVWVTVFVLFLILKKYFFEKVHNFVKERENSIKETYDIAERTSRQADEKLDMYNDKILKSEAEAREIIKNAKVTAETKAKGIIEEANEKAAALLRDAQTEIERQKLKAMTEVKGQIADIAVLAAEKIMEKQLKVDGQVEIIDKIIGDAGGEAWQN